MSSAQNDDYRMLEKMLDALDFPVYTFDRNRNIIRCNAATPESLKAAKEGSAVGAAVTGHFEDNEYYDEDGMRLSYPNGSVVDLALQGKATHNLLLEHRNVREHTHQWICVSCVPVTDENGEFDYGILWYRDISSVKSKEDKLRFLMESAKILSLTMDFEERLQRKALLAVPTLADWCAVEVVERNGGTRRVSIVHRDPKMIEHIKEYERIYPVEEENQVQRVVRTGVPEFTPHITDEMIDAAPDLSEAQRNDVKKLHLSSIMVLPIGQPGKVLGTLTLAYAESGRVYTEDDLAFFKEFANHLSVLLENARLYQEISQRDQAKDAFLASLSHELRNPLSPIKTAVELLQLRNQDPALTKDLEVIEHQFDHLARLLNDLLDTARFVQGKITLTKDSLNLTQLVDYVTHAVEPMVQGAGISLVSELPEEAITVSGDATRLEQAITNIINNAIKFTPTGGKVSVRLISENDQAVIAVRDTGAGITQQEMDHIFESYYQSERVRPGNSGLGIGLRLVDEIVFLHDGTVSAKSEGLGKGSEFIIRIPHMENTVPVSGDMREESSADLRTILVVDDNQAAADGLVRLLQALGWDAHAQYSGEEALAELRAKPVDVVFLDIGMPTMDGYEVMKQLRSAGYGKPVVALTGYGLEQDQKRAQEAGFTAHLTKPIGAKEIRTILGSLLEG